VVDRFDKTELEEILARARRGSDFAGIFIEQKESTRIGCEARQIERVISGAEQGAGIRAVRGENTAYDYSNALGKESLLKLAKQVSRAAGAPGCTGKIEQCHLVPQAL
jgi:TldD protein